MPDFETTSEYVAVTVAVKASSTPSGLRHAAGCLLIETRQDPRLLGADKKATRFRESLSVVRPKGFEPLAFCSVVQTDALAAYLVAFALVSAAIRGAQPQPTDYGFDRPVVYLADRDAA